MPCSLFRPRNLCWQGYHVSKQSPSFLIKPKRKREKSNPHIWWQAPGFYYCSHFILSPAAEFDYRTPRLRFYFRFSLLLRPWELLLLCSEKTSLHDRSIIEDSVCSMGFGETHLVFIAITSISSHSCQSPREKFENWPLFSGNDESVPSILLLIWYHIKPGKRPPS